MNIPWILIAIFVSLCLFYYFNQKASNRREDRRERLREKRQEYLDSLLETLKDKEPKDSTPNEESRS
jgi:hypothetical protein